MCLDKIRIIQKRVNIKYIFMENVDFKYQEIVMKCKCGNQMVVLTSDYNAYDDIMGIYLYCKNCGRVFYKDMMYPNSKGQNDLWIEHNGVQ
jgi:hypothetical protein